MITDFLGLIPRDNIMVQFNLVGMGQFNGSFLQWGFRTQITRLLSLNFHNFYLMNEGIGP